MGVSFPHPLINYFLKICGKIISVASVLFQEAELDLKFPKIKKSEMKTECKVPQTTHTYKHTPYMHNCGFCKNPELKVIFCQLMHCLHIYRMH